MAYNQEIMPFRLDGKRALVTGGASGIGESVCRVFSDAGASVIVADINKAQAEALATQLPNGLSIECDITDESSVKAAFGSIGRLDILVNNAGIGLVGDVQETELKDFQRLFRVNVEGTFLVTKYAVPLLTASQGSIVNIGSVAGLVGALETVCILRYQRRCRRDDPSVGGGLSDSVPGELYLPGYCGYTLCRSVP